MTPNLAKPLVSVEGVTVDFHPLGRALGAGTAAVRAVDDVTVTVERGETLGIVGESGSGKTTLARTIMGLVRPSAGLVRFDDTDIFSLARRDLRRWRRRAQMVFQDPYASLDPRMTVGRIIREPLDIHSFQSRADRRSTVDRLLSEVGLSPAAAERYPHEFSGGQRQRIGIARALALGPELIVADEPISALDVSVRAQILALLRRIQQTHGISFVVIAHDLVAVRRISHRVAVMYLGRLIEVGPTRTVFEHPRHPYTQALLSAIPVADPDRQRRRRRIVLEGDIPSPSALPPGCRFHTRCWLYRQLGTPESCRTIDPRLVALTPGHEVACHFTDQAHEAAQTLANSALPPGGAERRAVPAGQELT